VRDIFQAKYGKGDDLVSLLKELEERWPALTPNHRILTDLSGRFFTVISESELESLSAFEAMLSEAFDDPDFGPWFERMTELVESGSREYYTLQR
jgi:hypothetical protein